jgi:hypothetical protein
MIQPDDMRFNGTRAVRDGQLGPVTCAACGCRLEAAEDGLWVHFGRLGGRDARGCRVECIDLDHLVNGRVLAALPA